MKKMLVLGMVLLLAACGSSFDEEGFQEVESYSEEAITTVDQAIYEVSSSGEITDDALEYATKLHAINQKYWEDGELGNAYDDSEISSWMIKRSRGNEEWVVDGDELSGAVYDVESDVGFLAEMIELVAEEPTEENIERLAQAIEYSRESTDELRRIVYNQ